MLPTSLVNPTTALAADNISPFQTAASSVSLPKASNSSSASSSSNQLTGNDFITLLAAQLKAQDPLNPIDPTTFVTQLVQFNQLQQLIDINQTLSPSGANASDRTVQPNLSPAAASLATPAAR